MEFGKNLFLSFCEPDTSILLKSIELTNNLLVDLILEGHDENTSHVSRLEKKTEVI